MRNLRRLFDVRIFRIAAFSLCAFAVFNSMAEAQSGRKVPKRPATPPTVDAPSPKDAPEPEPVPEPEKVDPQKPLAVLIVTLDSRNFSNGSNISNYILGSFIQRLKQSPSVEVRTEKEMNRKQAYDRAKAQAEAHVVWVEIEADSSSVNTGRLSDIEAGYTIFEPNTGKTKTQGRVRYRPYQPTVGVGKVNIPSPVPLPTGPNTVQYSLQQMGDEMADRVMDAFGILPPRQRP